MNVGHACKKRNIPKPSWLLMLLVGCSLFWVATPAFSESILRLEAPRISAEIQQELEKRNESDPAEKKEGALSVPAPEISTPEVIVTPTPPSAKELLEQNLEKEPAVFPQEADSGPILKSVAPVVDPFSIHADPAAPQALEELSESDLDELYAEVEAQAAVNVWDPFESFNRDMYAFNDTLNNVILSPVSKAYAFILPDEIRMVIHNFFYNIAAPKRILNCLFQGNFKGMGVEFGRFFINTVMGLGGFGDVASAVEPLKNTYDADTDQTLGRYDIPEGPYIVLPILNFFTLRSLVGMGGDTVMYPLTYVPNGGYVTLGASAVRIVNDMSFRLNAYETLRDASIDPYATFRDACVQYRRKKVQDAKERQSVMFEVSEPSTEMKSVF